MKVAVATVSALLVLAVVLPLAVSLIAGVPAVQDVIARRLASHLSEKLGTKVSIGRMRVRLINHVEIEGFYVEDFHGDTLLYVPHLKAPIIEPGLAGEPLTFGRVELERAELWLRRDSTGKMNIRELVKAIRGERPIDPDSRFRMHIMGIDADSLTFGLLRDDRQPRPRGVDFSRFVIRNADININGLSIAGDSVRIDIRSLAMDERSGFRVDDLSAHDLVVSRGAVSLDDVRILSGETDLNIPSIRILGSGSRWRAFRSFTDSVSVGVSMRNSRLGTDFLSNFTPVVSDWNITLNDLSAGTHGTISTLGGSVSGSVEHAGAGAGAGGSTFALDFKSRGLPDFANAHFEGNITDLDTDGSDLDAIMRSVTSSGISKNTLAILQRLGGIGFEGRVAGTLRDGFETDGTVSSDAGVVDGSALFAVHDRRVDLTDGRVSIPGFDLGRALGAEDFGVVSGEFAVSSSSIAGEITGLDFREYTYRSISLDGKLAGGTFEGTMLVRDPALDLDLAGKFDGSASVPNFDLNLELRRADLARAGLDRKDSVSLLSGRVVASLSGTGLDDLSGTVKILDPHYVSQHGAFTTSRVVLSAHNNDAGKHLDLQSDFADAEFRSHASYHDILDYLGGFIGEYVPLPGLDTAHRPTPPTGENPTATANYSTLGLDIKNTDGLLGALMPTAQIAEGSGLQFSFNPYTGDFSLSAHSDFVEYRGVFATDIRLTSDNAADSLTVLLSGSDVYAGTMHFPDFALHGGAKGGQRIDISSGDKMWRITARSAKYGKSGAEIDDLRIFPTDNPSQALTASGIISRGTRDTLHVRLNDFDISPLGSLLRGGNVELQGRATGNVEVVSVSGDPKINARLGLDGLSVNGMTAPPLRLTSFWDEESERIGFNVLNRARGVDVLSGSVSPGSGQLDAVVRMDSLDVALLDPLLGDVLAHTRGNASANLTLGGTVERPDVNGTIKIPHLETTIKYTGATYSLSDADVEIENSVATLPHAAVSDRFGGSGDFAMRVDMSNLTGTGIGVEIGAGMRNLLAFDTDADDNDAFYGRVFATGSLDIRSGRMGTRLDISARTDPGTAFHLPLNARSNISWANFVVFADPSSTVDTTDVLGRKRLAYERRLASGTTRSTRRMPLEANITVNLTPDAEIDLPIDPNLGGGITAHGEGMIGLGIDSATGLLTMTGDYEISSGRFDLSMMDVFNKNFVISPGSTLRWTGSPDDALLDVDASYRVRTSLSPLVGEEATLVAGRSPVPVDCIVRLRESLSEPEITFDIDLPSADPDSKLIVNNAMNTQELKSMQFLSLVMTGSFASDNSITGQSANSGAMATGAVGFDILTNQLNNFLSSEDYDVYFRYRPQDNFATSQFDVGLSTGFIDNRLLLEIEGNYVDDRAATNVGTNASNLAGDVSLTWVIDKAGNLRLKVFSQTIDRLNETQGLQESGLGIHYKKDFDSFGDIFHRKSSNFDVDNN